MITKLAEEGEDQMVAIQTCRSTAKYGTINTKANLQSWHSTAIKSAAVLACQTPWTTTGQLEREDHEE